MLIIRCVLDRQKEIEGITPAWDFIKDDLGIILKVKVEVRISSSGSGEVR